MFDLITCNFVLHHIEDLGAAMVEIKRVLKPNGYLLIMEHDMYTDMDHMLLDIQHMIYATLYDKNDQYIDNPIHATYYNYIEWDYIMLQSDMEYVYGNYAYAGYHDVQYDMSFFGFYRMNSKK
jgi:ubiquinone/menaquinone biosynthesis C-methylase UbiE